MKTIAKFICTTANSIFAVQRAISSKIKVGHDFYPRSARLSFLQPTVCTATTLFTGNCGGQAL